MHILPLYVERVGTNQEIVKATRFAEPEGIDDVEENNSIDDIPMPPKSFIIRNKSRVTLIISNSH